MEYLVIALVIALALAPLSHFVPSKRQRQLARLRETAAVQGLFVEFRKLPDGAGSVGGGRAPQQPRGDIIYYGKRLPAARGRQPERGSWLRDNGDWRGVGNRARAPEILRDLPPQVLAASVDEGSCGVYWQEAGDEAELADLIRVVTSWSRQLRP